MSDNELDKLNKLLTFIYSTIKISTRDLYVLPLGHIDSFIKMSGLLAITSFICKLLNIFCFLDFKGVVFAFIILIVIKIIEKRLIQENKNNF